MDFLEPHAICLTWDPLLIWLLVIFNSGIALAYFIIAGALLTYIKPGRYPTLVYLFAVFIFGCGGTHVMQVVTMYSGGVQYWIEMLICGMTFIVSACTAMVLMTHGSRIKQWTDTMFKG